jgi:Rod binding domain-containing protein
MKALELKINNELKHISSTPELGNNLDAAKKLKLKKTARDFESLLTSMMMKSMTAHTKGISGSQDSNGEDESYGGDYFDSIFQQQIAAQLSKGKGIGIAEMLYKKLTGEDLNDTPGKINPIKTNNTISDPVKIINDTQLHSVKPSESSFRRVNNFDGIIDDASKKYGVDKNLIKSVILAESAGNVKAYSKASAKGLMQLIDSTAKDMGVQNVWDPRENINGGTKYLSGLLRQYNGDIKLALAAYNAGPGAVNKYNGVPPFDETKNYVSRVIGYFNNLNVKV